MCSAPSMTCKGSINYMWLMQIQATSTITSNGSITCLTWCRTFTSSKQLFFPKRTVFRRIFIRGMHKVYLFHLNRYEGKAFIMFFAQYNQKGTIPCPRTDYDHILAIECKYTTPSTALHVECGDIIVMQLNVSRYPFTSMLYHDK